MSELDLDIRSLLAPHFDEKFYLTDNPDVAMSNMDPLAHYHNTGWREGRNPSRSFNTSYYLARYTDIAAANLNPLLHFVLAGQQEGRDPVRLLEAWRGRLDATRPLRVVALDWKTAEQNAETIDQDQIASVLLSNMAGRTLIISISHDNYAENFGGVQNLIADEESAASGMGCRYLHIWPASPLPMMADHNPHEDFFVGLRLGRNFLGFAEINSVVHAITRLSEADIPIELVIHHFMGHAPELVMDIIEAARVTRPIVWAHDFFTSCPNYTLLRNDVVFCHSPPISSAACTICSYGEERIPHVSRIKDFFEKTRPILLAPSETALEKWLSYNDLAYSDTAVVPLGRLALAPSESKWAPGRTEAPLRVAHVGTRSFHKGWPVFEALALQFCDDPRYSFYQIGVGGGLSLPGCIQHIPVQVTRDTRIAMVEAIAEARIDIVLSWPLWPETFSFVAHEALAAGAFLVTNPDAGNVLPVISKYAPGQGLSVNDRTALFSLFESNEIIRRLRRATRSRGAFIIGSGTIDWLNRDNGLEADQFAVQERLESGASING